MARFACEKILLGEGLVGLLAGCLQRTSLGAYVTSTAFALPWGVGIGYWGYGTDKKDEHVNQDLFSMIFMGEGLTAITFLIGYFATSLFFN